MHARHSTAVHSSESESKLEFGKGGYILHVGSSIYTVLEVIDVYFRFFFSILVWDVGWHAWRSMAVRSPVNAGKGHSRSRRRVGTYYPCVRMAFGSTENKSKISLKK